PDSMLHVHPDGRVELRIAYPDVDTTCELSLVPRPTAVSRGWVSDCDVSGTVTIAGERHEIANCVGSYFETPFHHDLDRWVAHLDDGTGIHVWCDPGGVQAQLVRAGIIED